MPCLFCMCVVLKVYGNAYKIRIYERPDFGGQMAEYCEDCPSVHEAFKFREFNSCMVMDGAWAFYEQPIAGLCPCAKRNVHFLPCQNSILQWDHPQRNMHR